MVANQYFSSTLRTFLSVINTFYSSSPGNSPTISEIVSVVPGQSYDIDIELLRTDTGDEDEYADIIFNGNPFGKYNPNGGDGDCTWYKCSDIIKTQIGSSTDFITILIQYSTEVNDFSSSYTEMGNNCSAAAGIARVNLTPTNHK